MHACLPVFSHPRYEGRPHHEQSFSIDVCLSHSLLLLSMSVSVVHDFMLSIHVILGLSRVRERGIVPCINSFSMQSPFFLNIYVHKYAGFIPFTDASGLLDTPAMRIHPSFSGRVFCIPASRTGGQNELTTRKLKAGFSAPLMKLRASKCLLRLDTNHIIVITPAAASQLNSYRPVSLPV